MRTAGLRRLCQLLSALCVLATLAGSTTILAWPAEKGQPSTPQPPRLGEPPSLTPEQIRVRTTSTRTAPIGPRAAGQSRAEVVNLFNTQYTPALQVPDGWTGSVAGCVPGVTSPAYEAATIQMVNYFRTMAGLPTVTLDLARTAADQAAALIMKAQNDLSHTPPNTWTCWTQAGADAAGRSNLYLGRSGASAVAGYIEDEGVPGLGHRRWILFPPQVQIGTGSTDTTNALDVVGGFGPRPAGPEYVAWPPPGFVPYQVVYNTWSLSLPNADFANATVTMTHQGAPVQLAIVQLPNGFGDPGISWRPQGLDVGAGVTDRTFAVTVGNAVVGGTPRTFTYNVTVIDTTLTPPNEPLACAPRPRPTVNVVASGAGRITATITASGANNPLTSLRIGSAARPIANATVDVQGGPTGVANGHAITLPTGATQVVLTVTRQAPGAALVPLVLVDGCGDWPTFVGMGANVP